jgi:hypothetical protein
MGFPHVNYLAVLTAGVVIFILGGLWYSPLLFANRWMALMGMTEADMKAAYEKNAKMMPLQYLIVFFCGLLTAFMLALVVTHFPNPSPLHGALVGAGCWLGFAGSTSFGTALFSLKPKELWAINSGYNLVSFIVAGLILGAWR